MSVYDTNAPGAFGAGGYADASLAANTAYKNTLARINAKRGSTLQQFGYTGEIDPTSGVIQNVRVDGNNAFGGLQSMLRRQAGDFQQADFAAQERGLHGGLAHKADSALAYQHGAESAQLGDQFVGALGGFQDDQSTAAYTRDAALREAMLANARTAVDGGNFNPGDYTGLDYSGYGDDPTVTDNTDPTTTTSKAQQVAAKVISNATKRAVATSKVAKASSAAKAVATKAGATAAQSALAARSAGLNARYGLPKKGGK